MPVHAIARDDASLARHRRREQPAAQHAVPDDQRGGQQQQHHHRDEQRARAAHDELLRAQTDDVDVDAEVAEELARRHVAEVEQQRRHEGQAARRTTRGTPSTSRTRDRREPRRGRGVAAAAAASGAAGDRRTGAHARHQAPAGVLTTIGGPGSTSRAATASQISDVGHSSVPVKLMRRTVDEVGARAHLDAAEDAGLVRPATVKPRHVRSAPRVPQTPRSTASPGWSGIGGLEREASRPSGIGSLPPQKIWIVLHQTPGSDDLRLALVAVRGSAVLGDRPGAHGVLRRGRSPPSVASPPSVWSPSPLSSGWPCCGLVLVGSGVRRWPGSRTPTARTPHRRERRRPPPRRAGTL